MSGAKKCTVIGCGKAVVLETFCDEHKMFAGAQKAQNAATASVMKAINDAKQQRAKDALAQAGARAKTLPGAAGAGAAAGAGSGEEGPVTNAEQLHARLRGVWRSARRVVCKDLPRLAKRMNISEQSRGAVVSMGVALHVPAAAVVAAAPHPYSQAVPDGSGFQDPVAPATTASAAASAGAADSAADKKTAADPVFGRTPHFFDVSKAAPAGTDASAVAGAGAAAGSAGDSKDADADAAAAAANAAAKELAERLIPLAPAAAAAPLAAGADGRSPVASPVGSPRASPPMGARSLAPAAALNTGAALNAGGSGVISAGPGAKLPGAPTPEQVAATNRKVWSQIEAVVRALALNLESGTPATAADAPAKAPANTKAHTAGAAALAAALQAGAGASSASSGAAAAGAADASSEPAKAMSKVEQIEMGLSKCRAAIEAHPSAAVDFEAVVDGLMRSYVGFDSRVGRVLRICHQSVIFPALGFLHTKLFSQLGAMKDVRSDDGWNVNIYLGAGAVYVTHVRWEQSVMAAPDAFQIKWELQCSFDRDLKDLRAVFVRVLDVKYCADITPATREKVSNIARGNGYIIS